MMDANGVKSRSPAPYRNRPAVAMSGKSNMSRRTTRFQRSYGAFRSRLNAMRSSGT